jgi:hypothetical protein
VYSGKILGFIVSNEGKLPDLKRIQEIVNMRDPKTPQQIQVYTSILCCQGLFSFSNSQLLIHKKLCSLLHNFAFHDLDMLMPDDPFVCQRLMTFEGCQHTSKVTYNCHYAA